MEESHFCATGRLISQNEPFAPLSRSGCVIFLFPFWGGLKHHCEPMRLQKPVPHHGFRKFRGNVTFLVFLGRRHASSFPICLAICQVLNSVTMTATAQRGFVLCALFKLRKEGGLCALIVTHLYWAGFPVHMLV